MVSVSCFYFLVSLMNYNTGLHHVLDTPLKHWQQRHVLERSLSIWVQIVYTYMLYHVFFAVVFRIAYDLSKMNTAFSDKRGTSKANIFDKCDLVIPSMIIAIMCVRSKIFLVHLWGHNIVHWLDSLWMSLIWTMYAQVHIYFYEAMALNWTWK